MAKRRPEAQKHADRAEMERLLERRRALESLSPDQLQALLHAGVSVAKESPLERLVNSGEFTRLIIRHNGDCGASFTVKATLDGLGPSYLHGKVSNSWELYKTIQDVIEKGRWHEDKYPAKE